MTYARKLYNRIERLRNEIHELINNSSGVLNASNVVQKSQELDVCILEYQTLQANSEIS